MPGQVVRDHQRCIVGDGGSLTDQRSGGDFIMVGEARIDRFNERDLRPRYGQGSAAFKREIQDPRSLMPEIGFEG